MSRSPDVRFKCNFASGLGEAARDEALLRDRDTGRVPRRGLVVWPGGVQPSAYL